MSIALKEAHEQFTNIMIQSGIDEHKRRQALLDLAKSIGACTRHPSHDGVTASQAELIQHILTKFQMMSLVETHMQNSKVWIIALVSAIAALFSAIASWVAVVKLS